MSMSALLHQRLPLYATVSQEEAERYAESTRKGHYDLSEAEIFWRDRQLFLQTRGYMLRPRYCHGWTPSWTGNNRDPMFCEDSIMLRYYHIIDATRHDGKRVAIKRIPRDTNEIPMALSLTTPDLLQDPTNHCVPVLDVLDDPFDTSISFMIMPFLRPCNSPEFSVIGEAIDFIRQTLQGMCFLHKQNIAHRDCAAANTLMDAQPLYQHGYHAMRQDYSIDAIYEVSPRARIDHPVKYYFIDFELSVHVPEGSSPLVLGRIGRDKTIPELSFDVPYDAFKADVYALGNMYDKEFLKKYHGLDFLQPLIDAMKKSDPNERSKVTVALAMFEDICVGLTDTLLRWRLRARNESAPVRVIYDTVAAAREGLYQFKRLVT